MKDDNVEHMRVKKEITAFMDQLFPDPPLNKYMWQHMAASLKGTNENQVFNIYTGTGRNGKSKLVDLISMGDIFLAIAEDPVKKSSSFKLLRIL